MKHWILSREGSLSIILVIWLFNSCVLKLKYASLVDIFKNYFSCFKDKEGHLLIAPLLNYMILTILLAGIIARENPISETIQNILTVLISILTSMLFALLTTIIQMKAKIKEDLDYYSIEANTSKQALIETYYIVMFEIAMCVSVLILCLVNLFTGQLSWVFSFLIYACSFLVIFNLLVVVKRIFRVIDTDMNK